MNTTMDEIAAKHQALAVKAIELGINISGVKHAEFASEETNCFTANVLLNGKKIAVVNNDGHGGCNLYHVTNQVTFDEVMNILRGISDFEPLDAVICELLNRHLEDKQLRRWCRTKIVFRIKGDPKDQWRMIKAPYNEQVKQFIASKYGDTLEEVVNSRFAA